MLPRCSCILPVAFCEIGTVTSKLIVQQLNTSGLRTMRHIIVCICYHCCSSVNARGSTSMNDAEPTDDEEHMEHYDPIKSVGNDHQVFALGSANLSHHDLQCMQHGLTVIRCDSAGHSSPSVVVLRLENDGRTVSWARPVWASLRGGTSVLVGAAGGLSSASAAASSLGSTSTSSSSSSSTAPGEYAFSSDADLRISPALMCRYQMQQSYRCDEFDDGFIDIAVIKDFSTSAAPSVDSATVFSSNPGSSSAVTSRRLNVHGLSGVATSGTSAAAAGLQHSFTGCVKTNVCLTLLFGVGTTDNRTVEFIVPPRVAQIWQRGLTHLVNTARAMWRRGGDVDLRVQWLQEQYLQLYFDTGRCHGPTPAEAIKVCSSLGHQRHFHHR